MSTTAIEGKALRRARETGECWAVVAIDSGDCRAVRAVPLAYCAEPEFSAFDGRVLAVATPSGDLET